jgi:hypothetical protein
VGVTATAANTGEGLIDAHHHVWDLSLRDQEWINGRELAPLRRDFTLADLEPEPGPPASPRRSWSRRSMYRRKRPTSWPWPRTATWWPASWAGPT